MRDSATKPNPRAANADALAALKRDPAFLAADAATRQWILALLERGERAASDAELSGAEEAAK